MTKRLLRLLRCFDYAQQPLRSATTSPLGFAAWLCQEWRENQHRCVIASTRYEDEAIQKIKNRLLRSARNDGKNGVHVIARRNDEAIQKKTYRLRVKPAMTNRLLRSARNDRKDNIGASLRTIVKQSRKKTIDCSARRSALPLGSAKNDGKTNISVASLRGGTTKQSRRKEEIASCLAMTGKSNNKKRTNETRRSSIYNDK